MVRPTRLLLLASLVAGCAMFAPPKVKDPTAFDDCKVYKDAMYDECHAFLSAKEFAKAGIWGQVDRNLANAGRFRDSDFGKQFVAEVQAKRAVENLAPIPDTLDPTQVTEVAITMVSDKPICVEPRRFKVTVHLADGTTKETWEKASSKHGFIDFDAFDLTSTQGTIQLEPKFDQWGFRPAPNPVPAIDTGYVLKVAIKGRPEIKGEVTVPMTLDCYKDLVFSGPNGTTYGSGDNGTSGSDASPVTVDVGVVATKAVPKLLVIKGVSPQQTLWYAGALGAKVEIRNQGGAGGGGGPNQKGEGYAGGNGGNGGSLEIRYDKRHPELADALVASAPGGRGGQGGDGDSGAPAGKNGANGAPGPAPTKKAVDAKTLFAGDGLTLK